MASHNEITGDALVSKKSNENYLSNYDRIFRKKKENDNAGEDQLGTADGAAVSVSSVSGTGSAGTCGELRDNDTKRSAD